MAALISKLAITLMVVLAWRRAGGPVEPVALRRRLAWSFGLALGLRLALELLVRAPAGTARNAMAFVAALVALALLWPLLQLALVGPLQRPGRITRLVFTRGGPGRALGRGCGPATFFFWLALTRYAWPHSLRTPERFLVSVASLVAALALFSASSGRTHCRPRRTRPRASPGSCATWRSSTRSSPRRRRSTRSRAIPRSASGA
jgi:hypothetical protein